MEAEVLRVLILGNSFSAEGITRMLGEVAWIKVVDTVHAVPEAIASLAATEVDAIVLVERDLASTKALAPVLAQFPDKSVIRTSISENRIQIFTSRSTEANQDELLTALSDLMGNQDVFRDRGPVS